MVYFLLGLHCLIFIGGGIAFCTLKTIEHIKKAIKEIKEEEL